MAEMNILSVSPATAVTRPDSPRPTSNGASNDFRRILRQESRRAEPPARDDEPAAVDSSRDEPAAHTAADKADDGVARRATGGDDAKEKSESVARRETTEQTTDAAGRPQRSEAGNEAPSDASAKGAAIRKLELENREVLNLKAATLNQLGESRRVAAEVTLERMTLDKLGMPAAPTQPAAPQAAKTAETRAEVPIAGQEAHRRPEPVEKNPHDTAEPVHREVKSEPRTESVPLKPLTESRNTPAAFPNQAAAVDTQSRDVMRLTTPSRTAAAQEALQEMKERVLTRVENGIFMLAEKGDPRVTIKLYPPELGKVQIDLQVKDSVMDVQIRTENSTVREVILANLEQLKTNVENSGLQMGRCDVDVGDFRQYFAQSNGDGERNARPGNGRGRGGSAAGIEAAAVPLGPYGYYLGRSVNIVV